MELGNESISVRLGQRHERPTHDDIFYLVDAVAQAFYLVYTTTSLLKGIVSGSNGAHRCGLIAGVGLGGILEVAVRASRAVDADIPSVRYVRTAMRLAHYRYNRYARRCPYGFGDELGQDVLLVMLGNSGDDGGQRRLGAETMALCDLPSQAVEIEIFLRLRAILLLFFIILNEGAGNVGAGAHKALIFRWQLDILRLLALPGSSNSQCFGRHTCQNWS